MQWSDLIQWARDLSALASFAALLIRPVREWLFGFGAIREGLRCMLRSEITRLYYRHRDDRQLREFEFKNMQQCYDAYKALKGNSFIDRLQGEMQEWDII